ncbi:MAG TPA: hypothetical protein VG318_06230 [Actinomycetota bacterium]|nr:hypothetical protein [Actinomycetota bacterium]
MKKLRGMLAVGLIAGALSVGTAAPAHASCDTEIGDWCKFMDFVCDTNPKITQLVIAYCRP